MIDVHAGRNIGDFRCRCQWKMHISNEISWDYNIWDEILPTMCWMVVSACSWLKPFSNLVQSCSIMLLLLLLLKKNISLVQLLFDFIPQVLVGQPYCWQKFYSPQQHVNIFLEQSPRHPERISSFAWVISLPTCDWWIQATTSLFDQLNVPVDIQPVNSITAKNEFFSIRIFLTPPAPKNDLLFFLRLIKFTYIIHDNSTYTKCLPQICPLVLLRITLLAANFWSFFQYFPEICPVYVVAPFPYDPMISPLSCHFFWPHKLTHGDHDIWAAYMAVVEFPGQNFRMYHHVESLPQKIDLPSGELT